METGILMIAYGIKPTKAQRKTIKEQELKDLKVKNYLFQAIGRTIMEDDKCNWSTTVEEVNFFFLTANNIIY